MVAGFLWALALMSDMDVTDLRARMDTRRDPATAFEPTPPVTRGFPPVINLAGPSEPGVSRLDARTPDGTVASPVMPVDPDKAPPWVGLGFERIERTRPAVDGAPAAAGRSYTSGPDGRPVRLGASYAAMAAETARDLSSDINLPETGSV